MAGQDAAPARSHLVPTAAYAAMFAGQPFPPTESRAAGVTLQGAFAEMCRPLFLLVWLCMWLTAATELGPGQWYANIFNDVMGAGTQAGIILQPAKSATLRVASVRP